MLQLEDPSEQILQQNIQSLLAGVLGMPLVRETCQHNKRSDPQLE